MLPLTRIIALVAMFALLTGLPPFLLAQQPQLIGYTQFQTNLPGGRHANVRTMRAMVMNADGTEHREVADGAGQVAARFLPARPGHGVDRKFGSSD